MRLLTIPHTGTHWACEVLDLMGVDYRHHHVFAELPPYVGTERVVFTVRDREKARLSALKRGEPVFAPWHLLEAFRGDPQVFFLDIEDPDIEGLAEFCGVSPISDLPPPRNVFRG